MNLKDKKILITGATGGIGGSLVKKFTELGSRIVACGTNEEKLNDLKKNFSKIHIEKFRLDEHDKIENFVEQIDKKLDGVEILVNNADKKNVKKKIWQNNKHNINSRTYRKLGAS